MKFNTQYERIFDSNKKIRFTSNVGNREKDIYTPKYDENGVMYLEKTGKENLYDFIQSHKDSVDIHVLLQKYAEGDISVMSRVQGVYGDFTEMPKTYAEALNAMISAENYFNSLPVEVRANFGHSFQQFLVSMDKPGFVDKMSLKDSKLDAAADLEASGVKSAKLDADPASLE